MGGEEEADSCEEENEFARVQEELSCFITPSSVKRPAAQEGLEAMQEVYLPALALSHFELNRLKVVHVAGTKGKGSTCAFTESVLRAAGKRTGLFTSPHLVDVRERIRVDGAPISKRSFVRLFDANVPKLRAACAQHNVQLPAYFRLLALLALRHFADTGVDVSVLEVGLGGRLDATNVVPSPKAIGITSLGYDHTAILGSTLTQIAREKAGVMRHGHKVFTPSTQPEEALQSLEQCASNTGAELVLCDALADDWACGLPGAHQRENASVAMHLARQWWAMSEEANPLDDDTIRIGLERTRWPGRGQVETMSLREFVSDTELVNQGSNSSEGNATLLLDGAHTPESCMQCGRWFASSMATPASSYEPDNGSAAAPERVLLFNCKPDRDARSLLSPLAHALEEGNVMPHAAMFPPPEPGSGTLASSAAPSPREEQRAWQANLRSEWDSIMSEMCGKSGNTVRPVSTCPQTLSEALREVARKAHDGFKVRVLVTGSLYLVGDVLRLLRKPPVA